MGGHYASHLGGLSLKIVFIRRNRVAISKLVSAIEKDCRENEVSRAFAQLVPHADR